MRVIFVNRGLGMFRGGGETFALNVAKGLKDLGCELRFISSRPLFREIKYPVSDFDAEYVHSPYLRDLAQQMSSGCTYFDKIPFKFLRNTFQRGFRFSAGILFNFDDIKSQNDIFSYIKKREQSYDIIQVFSHSDLASRIVDELRVPVVIRFPGPPGIACRRQVLKCNACIANGDAFIQIRDHIDPNVLNIPPGIDSEKFKPIASNIRQKHKIGSNEHVIVFVGRFAPLKNLPFLIKGMAEVIKSKIRVKLMLVGEGPLHSRAIKLVKDLGIQNNVVFTGRIYNDILPEYYSAADIFAITSNYDNFPNAVLEAMSCGLPIIGTKVGGIPQQVSEGVNGFLVKNNDTRQFKEAVSKLVQNRETCKIMGENNRKTVKAKYDWQKTARDFLTVYEGILRGETAFQ